MLKGKHLISGEWTGPGNHQHWDALRHNIQNHGFTERDCALPDF